MPNVVVKVPQGALSAEQRQILSRQITQAVATAEQIPDDPRQRMLCWVLIEEILPGCWTCGGMDMTPGAIPCWVMVHLPAGVLDEAARHLCVRLIHAAFEGVWSSGDPRRLMTSIVLHEVPEGRWGANGTVWALSDFARNAGYRHLQHVVAADAGPNFVRSGGAKPAGVG